MKNIFEMYRKYFTAFLERQKQKKETDKSEKENAKTAESDEIQKVLN